jgi:hypothetical protein
MNVEGLGLRSTGPHERAAAGRRGWPRLRWPLGLLPTLVVMGAVLGALGSAVAMRRYLRV